MPLCHCFFPPCRYDFPPRVEAVQDVITLVQGHPRHHILLGVDSLGKGVSDSPGNNGMHVNALSMEPCQSCVHRRRRRSWCSAHVTEEVLAAVAAAVSERICVPASRFDAIRMLGLPAQQLFTTDPTATRIHAILRHQACDFSLLSLCPLAVKDAHSTEVHESNT